MSIKPLKWNKNGKNWQAIGAGIVYSVTEFDNVVTITWVNLIKLHNDAPRSSDGKTYTSYSEAMDFVNNTHYPHFMSEFVSSDSISTYFDKFTQWSTDRQIIQNGDILAQGLKLVSEIGELTDNLAKDRCIKDDVGDCMVVLNNLARMTDTPLEDCLAQAWNDIKDRKGTMNEHGVFIKDGDEVKK